MDNDDEPITPDGFYSSPSNVMTTTFAPNHFLLSTYKDNQRLTNDSHHDYQCKTQMNTLHGTYRHSLSLSYKCCLCRKIVDDATLTCAKCVNTGRFCPSKHDTCSNKRRQTLVNMLNAIDKEEFYQYSNKYSINTPAHLQ
jgi:hypothetical protein